MAASQSNGVSILDLPKSNVFTKKLPPDPEFPTPAASHKASRAKLGPRRVKGALYTYVRPEKQRDPELLAVSPAALKDLGLREGEQKTEIFRDVVAGNRVLGWEEEDEQGDIYPWAQCYGGMFLYIICYWFVHERRPNADCSTQAGNCMSTALYEIWTAHDC